MAERRNNYEKHAIIVATENISSYTAHMSEQNYINNVHPNNLESSYSKKKVKPHHIPLT